MQLLTPCVKFGVLFFHFYYSLYIYTSAVPSATKKKCDKCTIVYGQYFTRILLA
jgi:hypothetical protein